MAAKYSLNISVYYALGLGSIRNIISRILTKIIVDFFADQLFLHNNPFINSVFYTTNFDFEYNYVWNLRNKEWVLDLGFNIPALLESWLK